MNEDYVWEGSAEMLEDLLSGNVDGWTCSVSRSASRLLGRAGASTMLARLREDRVDRVDKRDRDSVRGWAVAAPAASNMTAEPD